MPDPTRYKVDKKNEKVVFSEGMKPKEVTFKVKGQNYFGLGPLKDLRRFPENLRLNFTVEWLPEECEGLTNCPVMTWKNKARKYEAVLKPEGTMLMTTRTSINLDVGCDASATSTQTCNCQLKLVKNRIEISAIAGPL